MGKESAGGLNLQALAEHLPGEILASRDLDQVELVQGAGIDAIGHVDDVGSSFLLDVNRGVEVATALEIIEEVAPALIQQVLVEGIFLVDRNVFFQDAAADVKTLGTDENYGAGLDQIGIVPFDSGMYFCSAIET